MVRWHWRRVLAAAIPVALAACPGGDDPDEPSDTDTQTQESGPTDSDDSDDPSDTDEPSDTDDTDAEPEYTTAIYVDDRLAVASCDTYDVATRSCDGGAETAYATLAGAAAVADAGFAVFIRGGTFGEPLVVERSGTESARVYFLAYEGEQVVITGDALAPAIELSDRQHVVVEGLTVDGVRRWMYALNAHHNVIRGNTFSRALDSGGSSKTGLFFQQATYNRIVGNTIEDSTQDNLALHACDHNLIEGNTIREAAHTLWAIKCGNFNVVRGNHFENEVQKIGEIYDCDASGFDHDITANDATKHNLVEGNTFALAVKYYSTSGGNGIQNAGQHGIIRRNVFYDTNAGLGLQRYSDEANYDRHNRAYHNVFAANECGGTGIGSGTTEQFDDNLFVNNIFFENVGCEGGGEAQVVYRALAGFSFVNNNIRGATAGAGVIQELFGGAQSLAWFESNHPELFRDNLEEDPLFEDAAGRDFRLTATSPMVDAGAFLTQAVGAGSGTSLTVRDASWFFDGFGIAGEVGDEVQLQGQTATARIVAVDYDADTLTLDRSLTWDDGVGVHLAYSGAAPDIGAFER